MWGLINPATRQTCFGLEETKRYFKESYKFVCNFENTKKVLDNIKLELPQTPNINDIKLIKLNREKS